jgi:c-di-GMP-binding flagellar brake protein YcgR
MRPSYSLMDDERYHVRARLEVLQILRTIAQSGSVMTAYAGQGQIFTQTTLLAVDSEAQLIYLEVSQDESINRRLLQSAQVLCVSAQDRVKVQFYADQLELSDFDDGPAFRARMPDWVMKLQRREYFRVVTPIAHPLLCQFTPLGPGVALPVHDIGLGGICVAGTHPQINLDVGTLHRSCKLDLPDTGPVTVDLEVRNFHDLVRKNGSHSRLTGFQFQKLTGTAQNLIQRFVSKLERDRRLREAD